MSKNRKSKLTEFAKSLPNGFKEWHLLMIERRFKALGDKNRERMKSDEEYRKKMLYWVRTGFMPEK